MGKIGLPVAMQIAASGIHTVVGIDSDEELLSELSRGTVTRVREPGIQNRLQALLLDVKISFSTPGPQRSDVQYVLIAVPVKLNQDDTPDFASLDAVVEDIRANLKGVEMVIVETTLPIGTTQTRVARKFTALERPPEVVFSPERVSSGTIIEDLANYPKILGSITEKGRNCATQFYLSFLGLETNFNPPEKGIISFETLEEAEAVKLFETTYRDVNIALANEFASVMKHFDGNFEQVVEAANSQPFSHIHKPGLNVGGHCIPVYPKFLMKSVTRDLSIVKSARELNQEQPRTIVTRIQKTSGNDVFDSGVLIIGLSYRSWVRESYKSGAIETLDSIKTEIGDKIRVCLIDPLFSVEEISGFGFEEIPVDFNPKVVIVNSTNFNEVDENLRQYLDSAEIILLGRGSDARFAEWSNKVHLP